MTRTPRQHNGRHAKPEPPEAPSLPLSPDRVQPPGEASLGDLVRDATTHFSTLIRSEVELAKAELTAEVRKGIKGSVLFIIALAILVFSLFFLFIAFGEVLDIWLPRWAAFSIVFGLMLVTAGGVAFIGWRRVRSIQKPKRTITAVRETGEVLTHLRPSHQHADDQLPGPQPVIGPHPATEPHLVSDAGFGDQPPGRHPVADQRNVDPYRVDPHQG